MKGAKPEVLVQNETAWTAAYVAAVGTDAEKTNEKWRHKQIKEALNDEASGKCAYCEAQMGDVTYPHVEHIIAKKHRPDLAHIWENLTWACPPCNVEKGEFYDPANPLLSPYEPVETDLIHLGHFVDWRVGSTRGEMTVRKLKLNRMDLADSRRRRIEAIRELLARWNDADGSLRDALAAAIRLDASHGEFSATIHAYLRSHGFPIDPVTGAEGAEPADEAS